MNFNLTEEQMQIKGLIREFCEREKLDKRIAEYEAKAAAAKNAEELRAVQVQSEDVDEKLHEIGLRTLTVPKKYGGAGKVDDVWVTTVIAAEEAGYRGSAELGSRIAKWLQRCHIWAQRYYVNEKQRDLFFGRFMEDHSMRMAGVRSDPAGHVDYLLPYDAPGVATPSSFAYKDGKEWVLNGDKMFSTGGAIADHLNVGMRTDKHGPVTKSLSQFWVFPEETPGVTFILNNFLSGGLEGNTQTHFDNVRIPEIQLIGDVNKGWTQGLDWWSTKWIAHIGSLGHLRRVYETLRDYAKQRVVGGKPEIEHSMIREHLGYLATSIEAARSLAYRAAWEFDQQEKAQGPSAVLSNEFWSMVNYTTHDKLIQEVIYAGKMVYGGISASLDLPIAALVRSTASGNPIGHTPMRASILYDDRYNHTFTKVTEEVEK